MKKKILKIYCWIFFSVQLQIVFFAIIAAVYSAPALPETETETKIEELPEVARDKRAIFARLGPSYYSGVSGYYAGVPAHYAGVPTVEQYVIFVIWFSIFVFAMKSSLKCCVNRFFLQLLQRRWSTPHRSIHLYTNFGFVPLICLSSIDTLWTCIACITCLSWLLCSCNDEFMKTSKCSTEN